jgi:hypothetical protein
MGLSDWPQRVRRSFAAEGLVGSAFHGLRWLYWNGRIYKLRLHYLPYLARQYHPRGWAYPRFRRWRRALREYLHFETFAVRERVRLAQARRRWASLYRAADEAPLVSVVIPTWNRGRLLVERTLPSVFAQSYQNLEIVVVGDHCTDDTAVRLAQLGHPQVRFYNLPERGDYPEEPQARWRVAGSVPYNYGLRQARGKWIALLDDDDVFTPDHVKVLLRHAQANDLELAYGKIRRELAPGDWQDRGEAPFASKICLNTATLFRAYVRLFRFYLGAWRLEWAVDKHRNWRMFRAGVRAGFLDQVVAFSPMRPGQTMIAGQAEDRAVAETQYARQVTATGRLNAQTSDR